MIGDLLPPQCAAKSVGAANQLVSFLLTTIISSHCKISNEYMWPEDYSETVLKEGLKKYDFIIIGAGTAGSVLANRLSENPNWNILVIEAGGDPPIEAEIPYLSFSMQNSIIDWKYYGEKSDKFGIGHERGIAMPRGKVLGGTSSMNHMYYVRGNKKNYDDWEKAGNPTWNWNNVVEYFKKSENMLDENLLKAYGGKYHSAGGLMSIGKLTDSEPRRKFVIDALQESGIQNLIDFNGEEYVGTAETTGCLANGVRQGPAKVFLASANDRPNLHVIKNAHVTNLKVTSSGVIKEVNFNIKGKHNMTAVASKEYILSAGVFNSPQIMMLSGIGPKSHLSKFNIPVYNDLNVGHNLIDHVIIPYFFKFPSNGTFNYSPFLKDYFQYLLDKNGTFASNFPLNIFTFFNTKSNNATYPDIQVIYLLNEKQNYLVTDSFFSALGLNDENFKNSIEKIQSEYAILIGSLILLNPKSKGHLELNSTNPYDNIKIYPNYLDHPDDIKTLINAIRRFQKLQNTKSFRQNGIEEFIPTVEKCNKHTIPDSDEFWECYIRFTIFSAYHNVGTCKMGSSKDPEAVVNSRLSVYNMKNLRVVDSSIMPNVVSGNTFAPTVMIAEKAADFIKEDWIDYKRNNNDNYAI